MGFYEDDRIRRKNRLANEAWELYEEWRSEGLSPQQIALRALSLSSINNPRNELYSSVVKIAEGRTSETSSKS